MATKLSEQTIEALLALEDVLDESQNRIELATIAQASRRSEANTSNSISDPNSNVKLVQLRSTFHNALDQIRLDISNSHSQFLALVQENKHLRSQNENLKQDLQTCLTWRAESIQEWEKVRSRVKEAGRKAKQNVTKWKKSYEQAEKFSREVMKLSKA